MRASFINLRMCAATAAAICCGLAAGCGGQQQPAPPAPSISMAPPISPAPGQNYSQQQQPGNGGQPAAQNYQQNSGGQPAGDSVYQWQDVPQGQQVPITRATFDQGGYQILANSGETIVVPFVNQNLYALKFGRTASSPYFVNDGQAPTLYLPPGGYLENSAAQNARWYPIPADYSYSQPMYVSVAPSWNEYVGMGWYPGMNYYGGMWGYSPYSSFAWMPGFYVGIGSSRYYSYTSYHSYYVRTPGYSRVATVYHNYSAPRSRSFGYTRNVTGRNTLSTGRTFGNPTPGNTGSFNTSRQRAFNSPNAGFNRPTSGTNTGSFNRQPGASNPGGGFGRQPSNFNSPGRTNNSSFNGNRGASSPTGRTGGSSFGRRR